MSRLNAGIDQQLVRQIGNFFGDIQGSQTLTSGQRRALQEQQSLRDTINETFRTLGTGARNRVVQDFGDRFGTLRSNFTRRGLGGSSLAGVGQVELERDRQLQIGNLESDLTTAQAEALRNLAGDFGGVLTGAAGQNQQLASTILSQLLSGQGGGGGGGGGAGESIAQRNARQSQANLNNAQADALAQQSALASRSVFNQEQQPAPKPRGLASGGTASGGSGSGGVSFGSPTVSGGLSNAGGGINPLSGTPTNAPSSSADPVTVLNPFAEGEEEDQKEDDVITLMRDRGPLKDPALFAENQAKLAEARRTGKRVRFI